MPRLPLRSRIPLSVSMPMVLTVPVLVTIVVVSLIAFVQSRAAIRSLVGQNLDQIHERIEGHVNVLLTLPARINKVNAALIRAGKLDIRRLRDWRTFLFEQARAFPALSCVEWGGAEGHVVWFARYPGSERYEFGIKDADTGDEVHEFLYADDGGVGPDPIGRYAYDPRNRPWYTTAIRAGGPAWTAPYGWVQRDGSIVALGMGYVEPFCDPSGRVLGVIDAELTLYDLSRFLTSLSIGKTGIAFVTDLEGRLMAHSTDAPVTGDDLALVPAAACADGRIAAAARQLEADRPDFRSILAPFESRVAVNGETHLLKVTPFQHETGLRWLVATVVPESDFMGEIREARRRTFWIGLVAVGGTLALGVVLAIMAMKPIFALMSHVRRIGGGDLEGDLRLDYSPEFSELAREINDMTAGLRDRLELRHSLAMAMEVQQNLLPAAAPVVEGLDMAGRSVYCDETGGDYYDFLTARELEGRGTVVVVGDVVGHGIAAAMLMATARGILRSHAAETPSLSELLVQTNEHLVEDVGVGTGNFMTLLLMALDPATGAARWASAGHDPPFVYDPAENAFAASGRGGLALGLKEGVSYPEHELPPLRSGQVCLVATDGVWETFNEDGEMFGKDRLREFIRRNAGAGAAEIAERLLAELEVFRGKASQDDDITYVVVKVL